MMQPQDVNTITYFDSKEGWHDEVEREAKTRFITEVAKQVRDAKALQGYDASNVNSVVSDLLKDQALTCDSLGLNDVFNRGSLHTVDNASGFYEVVQSETSMPERQYTAMKDAQTRLQLLQNNLQQLRSVAFEKTDNAKLSKSFKEDVTAIRISYTNLLQVVDTYLKEWPISTVHLQRATEHFVRCELVRREDAKSALPIVDIAVAMLKKIEPFASHLRFALRCDPYCPGFNDAWHPGPSPPLDDSVEAVDIKTVMNERQYKDTRNVEELSQLLQIALQKLRDKAFDKIDDDSILSKLLTKYVTEIYASYTHDLLKCLKNCPIETPTLKSSVQSLIKAELSCWHKQHNRIAHIANVMTALEPLLMYLDEELKPYSGVTNGRGKMLYNSKDISSCESSTFARGSRRAKAILNGVINGSVTDPATGQSRPSNLQGCSASLSYPYEFCTTKTRQVLIPTERRTKTKASMSNAGIDGAPYLLLLAYDDAVADVEAIRCFLMVKRISCEVELVQYFKDHRETIELELCQRNTRPRLPSYISEQRSRMLHHVKDIAKRWLNDSNKYDLCRIVPAPPPKPSAPPRDDDRSQCGRSRRELRHSMDYRVWQSIKEYPPKYFSSVFYSCSNRQALHARFIKECAFSIGELCGHAIRLVRPDPAATELLTSCEVLANAPRMLEESLSATCPKSSPCTPLSPRSACCNSCQRRLTQDHALLKQYAHPAKAIYSLVDKKTQHFVHYAPEPVIAVADKASPAELVERIYTIVRLNNYLDVFAKIVDFNVYDMVPFESLMQDSFDQLSYHGTKSRKVWFELGVGSHEVRGVDELTRVMGGMSAHQSLGEGGDDLEDTDNPQDDEPDVLTTPDISLFRLVSSIHKKEQHNCPVFRDHVAKFFLHDSNSGFRLTSKEKEACYDKCGTINLSMVRGIVAEKLNHASKAKDVNDLLTHLCVEALRFGSIVYDEAQGGLRLRSQRTYSARVSAKPDSTERQDLMKQLVNSIADVLKNALSCKTHKFPMSTSKPTVFAELSSSCQGTTAQGHRRCHTTKIGSTYWRMSLPILGDVLLPAPLRYRRDNRCMATLRYHLVKDVIMMRVLLIQVHLIGDMQKLISQYVSPESIKQWTSQLHYLDTSTYQRHDEDSTTDLDDTDSDEDVSMANDDMDCDEDPICEDSSNNAVPDASPTPDVLFDYHGDTIHELIPHDNIDAGYMYWAHVPHELLTFQVGGRYYHTYHVQSRGRWVPWYILQDRDEAARFILHEQFTRHGDSNYKLAISHIHYWNMISSVLNYKIANMIDLWTHEYRALHDDTGIAFMILMKLGVEDKVGVMYPCH